MCFLVSSTNVVLNFQSIIITLQPVTFILMRSSSNWSIQIVLFLLTGLFPCCFHSIFIVLLLLAIPITWATLHSLCDVISFIKTLFYSLSESSFTFSYYVAPGVCEGTYPFLYIFLSKLLFKSILT